MPPNHLHYPAVAFIHERAVVHPEAFVLVRAGLEADVVFEFGAELADGGADGPRRGVAEGADRAAGNLAGAGGAVAGDLGEDVHVFGAATAVLDALDDLE